MFSKWHFRRLEKYGYQYTFKIKNHNTSPALYYLKYMLWGKNNLLKCLKIEVGAGMEGENFCP